MSQKTISAVQGVVVAVIAALVTFGVLGGEQASAIQGVVVAAVAFAGAVGVRSMRPPLDPPAEEEPVVDPSEIPPGE